MSRVKELRQLAKEQNISLTVNGKYKTKEELLKEVKTTNQDKQVKQIVVPPNSKETVINIYMTQSNYPSHDIIDKKDKTTHHIVLPTQTIPKGSLEPIIQIDETPEEKKARQERTALAREKAKEQNKPTELTPQQKNMIALQEAIAKRNAKMEGKGITDWFKNAYNVIKSPMDALYKMPKQVLDTLSKYGNNTVNEIIIAKIPIKGIMNILLNSITLGTFEKEAKKYNYDDVFHLFAILKLDNGKKLITERNQRVVLKEISGISAKDVTIIKTNITLNKLFDNAIKMDGKNIWRYDPISNNCQKYITTLLKASNLFNEDLNKFINQNVLNLLPSTSKKIASTTTDVASIFENIFRGGSDDKLNMYKRLL